MRSLLFAGATLFLFLLPATVANHPQPARGDVLVFDHRTGNEWWVEVLLTGGASGAVASVEAMDTGGAWVALAKKSWGPYAASFHIEPGNAVRFRASWAGGDQLLSCWFTHPAGVEQCSAPPPPPPAAVWSVMSVGEGGGASGGTEMAVGDADHDGRSEVYLGTAGGLFQFAWTHTGWVRSPVVTWHGAEHVAVGDVTGDGTAELFAAGPSAGDGTSHVYRYEWDGQRWDATFIAATASGTQVGAMLVADVEDDGVADLYYGTRTSNGILTQIEVRDGTWHTRAVVPVPMGTSALAAGDGDNDGDSELFVGSSVAGSGEIRRLDLTPSTGTMDLIQNGIAGGVGALGVGDADRNGQRELYSISTPAQDGLVSKHQWSAGWTTSSLPDLPNGAEPTDLVVGDADNDDDADLYVGGDGHVYNIHWTGTAWAVRDLATTEGTGSPGLALGDGDGDGMRELYHAGFTGGCCGNPVDQIANHPVPARPPPAWDVSRIGDAGGRSGGADIATGDGDRDGQREVYVATRSGLFQFEWTGAAWRRTLLSGNDFARVAVGDGDRDGRPEVYGAGRGPSGDFEVTRFVADASGAWTPTSIYAATLPVGTMTLGDVDDDGTTELYLVLSPEFGGDVGSMPAFQLEFEGGAWQTRHIANVEGGARFSWIGDGDRDGDRELYVGSAAIHRLDLTAAGAGSASLIGGDLPGEDNWFNGIVAGDGDRDGLHEVYVGYTESGEGRFEEGIYRYAPIAGGWDRTKIVFPRFSGPRDLTLGDADGDGAAELYASSFDGGLWQASKPGAVWTLRKFADVGSEMAIDLALGDADGDGKVEAYVTAYDASRSPPHNVYRLGTVPPSAGFEATFTSVRGNEWWIQAHVAATGGTVATVDVSLNGGTWKPLALQSWGGWAASYRVVQGTTVQLRATAPGGATDLSDCHRWIPPAGTDAAIVTCGVAPPPPPPPSGFDAVFSGVKGNAWWVEAKVTANQPLAGVDARVNCGATWKPLTLKSWGAWAASFNVPSGAKVDFRARSSGGETDLSGGYVWPAATPTSAC